MAAVSCIVLEHQYGRVTSFEYALTMYWARLMKGSGSEPSLSLDRQSPSIRRLKRAKIFVGKKLDLLMRQTKWVD